MKVEHEVLSPFCSQLWVPAASSGKNRKSPLSTILCCHLGFLKIHANQRCLWWQILESGSMLIFVRDSYVLMCWPLIKSSSCPISLVALTLSLWKHNLTSCLVSSLNVRFKMLNDENCSHLLYFNCALRWFALRMDVLMNIVTFIVALLVTLSFSSISASSKGLSLSYIIQVTPSVQLGLAWRLWHRVYQAGWT